MAYEHVCIVPQSQLPTDLVENSLQAELRKRTINADEFDNDIADDDNGDVFVIDVLQDMEERDCQHLEALLVSEERMVGNPVMNIGVEKAQGPVDETDELISNYDGVED